MNSLCFFALLLLLAACEAPTIATNSTREMDSLTFKTRVDAKTIEQLSKRVHDINLAWNTSLKIDSATISRLRQQLKNCK